MTLSDGRKSVAGTVVVREIFGECPLDWLDVYLPLGGLAEIDTRVGGYPHGDTDGCQVWLEPISVLLGEIARVVCVAVAARLALIGFESSGDPIADQFDGIVPQACNVGYVVSIHPGDYQYWPPTQWA